MQNRFSAKHTPGWQYLTPAQPLRIQFLLLKHVCKLNIGYSVF